MIYKIFIWLISIIDYVDFHLIRKEKTLDNYKVIEEIPINGIDILTDIGYQPISYLYITKPYNLYYIELENGYHLECADEHIVFNSNLEEVYIKDLNIGDFIYTDQGAQRVMKIIITNIPVSMGDLTVDDNNHRFYTNGILSHNSVTTAIFCLWTILFNTDKAGLILSKSGPAGKDLLKKIKDMYMYLPYYLKCGTYKWNQSEISFDNNSSIATEAFSPTAGLGNTINFLILDEFAWCPPNDVELFYNNILPVVTADPNSNVCIMSTQNGFNLFYKLWKAAIEKKSDYAPFKVDWNQIPNFNPVTGKWEKRTEEWKKLMIGRLGSEEAFYYQYGTQFSASDKCLVSRECLSFLRDGAKLWENRSEDIPFTLYLLHPENLYFDPNFNLEELKIGFFLVLIDLAEGCGSDSTVFNILQVVDVDKFVHVGQWKSNEVDIENAALEFWLLMGQLFNDGRSLISIEWNTYGALFYNYLKDYNEEEYDKVNRYRFNIVGPDGIELTNIIRYKKTSIEEEASKEGGNKKKGTSVKKIPGIKFTSGNKKIACNLLKLMFEKKDIITTDLLTIGELENFEDKNGNGSYQAAFGHDDSIMTFVQLPMVKQTPRYKEWIEEVTVAIMNIQRLMKYDDYEEE